MSLDVKFGLRQSYMVHPSKKSRLAHMSPAEIEFAIREGFITINPKSEECKYLITQKGRDFIKHEEYDVSYDFMRDKTIKLFKSCWKMGDYSSLTKNQRRDLKRFGFVERCAAGFYLPSVEGCAVLKITPEEARQVYDTYNKELVARHPRVWNYKPAIPKNRVNV